MSFKKVLTVCASLLFLSTASRAQDLNQFQAVVQKLKSGLASVEEGRAYLNSHSLNTPALEKQLDLTERNIQMSAYSIGQWILPGLSYLDARFRLKASCEYGSSAQLDWKRLNSLLGEQENSKPEWKALFEKGKSALYFSCDD